MNEIDGLEYNEEKGFFFIRVNDTIEAKMTFYFDGEHKIIIDHTEVNAGNNGKGYGKKMVENAVEFSRKKGIVISPMCPFVKSIFDKTPEFRDVL